MSKLAAIVLAISAFLMKANSRQFLNAALDQSPNSCTVLSAKPIPPSVWTPLSSFYTDASLDGFGMVWGKRTLAGLFPMNFEHWNITKKEMVTVMAAVKHWFADLANLRVQIFEGNQACVALLNYGVTRCPILVACLREMYYFLAKCNIELRAQYIPSKENCVPTFAAVLSAALVTMLIFTKLLVDKVLLLEVVDYRKFHFEYDV